MRIVAGQAVGLFDRLVLMRFGDLRVFGIVTIQAQRRRSLGQMVTKLAIRIAAALVNGMAGIAVHIERRVTAALGRHVQPGGVAIQTEIVGLGGARHGLQQHVFVFRGVRIVTFHAVADIRTMDHAFDLSCILIGMAGDAKFDGGRREELDAGRILGHAQFVATEASSRDR